MDVCSSGEIFTTFTFWLVGVIVAGALLLLGYSAGVVALIMRGRANVLEAGDNSRGSHQRFCRHRRRLVTHVRE